MKIIYYEKHGNMTPKTYLDKGKVYGRLVIVKESDNRVQLSDTVSVPSWIDVHFYWNGCGGNEPKLIVRKLAYKLNKGYVGHPPDCGKPTGNPVTYKIPVHLYDLLVRDSTPKG